VSDAPPARPDAPKRPDLSVPLATWSIPAPGPLEGPWPLATWTLSETVVVFAAAFGVQYFISAFVFGSLGLDGVGARAISNIVVEIALGVSVILWLRWAKSIPASDLGFPQKPRGDVGYGLLVGFGLLVTESIVGVIQYELARAVLGHSPSSPPSPTELLTTRWVGFAVIAIVVCAPIGEEILFRGFLYQGLRRRFPVMRAALISAGAFAFVHVYPLRILPIFVSGVLLALLYERRRSLLASITAHATLNAIVVAVYLARH
jgi:membrane protease YdiL (CAAX protease family)